MSAYVFEVVETKIIECRKHPRFRVREEGALCRVPVELRSISRGGAQLACGAETFETLEPQLDASTVPVQIHVNPSLGFTAEIVYTNPSDDVCLIGVKFIDVPDEVEEQLAEYLGTLD